MTRKRACEQRQKFGEHEQASTRLNFASKSSKGKILRSVKDFNGLFITPLIHSITETLMSSDQFLQQQLFLSSQYYN